MRPPRLATWLVARCVPDRDRDCVLGDLSEEYCDRLLVSKGPATKLWYWREAWGCALVGLTRRSLEVSRSFRSRSRKEGHMRLLLQDVRYGLRSIRKNPVFSLVVSATLALGIAANTIVFSAVDGIVLNPFPYPEPDRLVGVGTTFPRLGSGLNFIEHMSPAEYMDIAGSVRSLEGVVAWDMGNRQVTFGEATENLFSAFWWGDAFPTLGVVPAMGRGFTQEEMERNEPVAILSHRVWQGRFGGDPSLVGGTILMNGGPYTVVGIMPERTLVYGTDLWLPMGVSPEGYERNRRQFQVLARVAPGQTLETVNTELDNLAGRIEAEYGAAYEEYAGWELRALTWNDINVRTLRPAALILLGAVVFVLLLVCANVASLLLARGAARGHEIAVRAALGAGRRRILAQLLTESVVLAGAGGVLGVLLGWAGVSVVSGVVGSLALPIPGNVAMSGRVLGFTALVSMAAGLAFGAVPAFHAARSDLQRTLQAESQSVSGSRARMRLQRVFVGIEVALALSLLAGSGLLVSSFLQLGRVDRGFDPSNVMTMRLTLAWQRYERNAIEPFFQQLREQVSAIPGVVSVSTTSQFPPNVFSRNQFQIEGAEATADAAVPVAYTTLVSPGYFETLRIPVLAGRAVGPSDLQNTPMVVVINEVAARRFFPGRDPLGQRVRLSDESPWMEIVGVVGSTQNIGIDRDPQAEMYASTLQLSGLNNQMYLMIRTRGSAAGVLPSVREAVRSIDPEQPVYAVRTLADAIRQTQATRRLSMMALAFLGAFALILAAVGIYGVVAYAVSQRTREIGVRMALGAERGQVRRLVVRQALVPVGVGVAAGLLAATGIGRLMSSLLFGVGSGDPITLLSAAALLTAAAILASWLPAHRASSLDPVRALRPE